MAVSATVFEILTLKARKSLNFSDRPFFEAPLGFGDEIWCHKTRVLGLPDGEETMPSASFLRFDTIPARDRQTDRQTDRHIAIAITRASIASRG